MSRRKREYKKYITSKEWRTVKKKKLREFPRCQRCGTTKNLQVHHNNYYRFKNERMSDLDVLCGKCHDMVHRFKAKY